MTTPQAEHVHVELEPAVVLAAYAGHRRRFALSVEALDEAELSAASRCTQWTVADVLRHACDVDRITRSIWAGEFPLRGFDPRITPHELVLERRSVPDVDPGVPVLTGDRTLVVDALGGRGAIDDVLIGDPAAVHRLGALALFFTTPV